MKSSFKLDQKNFNPPSKNRIIECPAKGKRYPPKLRSEILQFAETNSIGAASEKYQVSRSTIHVWQRRSRREKGNKDYRVESQDQHTKVITSRERDERVLEVWTQNPGYGPSQIKNMLGRLGLRLSVGTVRNIMEENGYIQPKMKAKERRGRYEASRPRELYHLDFYHFYIHKQKQVLLFIQDDFSRFIAGWALAQNETADAVIECFEKAVAQYGKPERVMSDRGSAFHSWKGLSRFEKLLEDY